MFKAPGIVSLMAAVAVTTWGSWAFAGEEVVASGPETDSQESAATRGEGETSVGVNVEVGFHSAYVFRGYNVFQDSRQTDQNMLLAPGFSWTIFGTGLTFGYWSAYQISGNDIGGNVDSGVGAEQDLYLSYEHAFFDRLNLGVSLFYYFYPAADENAAGVANPSYFEPIVSLVFSAGIDVGLDITYFLGIQDAIRDLSYLYVNPHIGKSIAVHEAAALEFSFGYGFKAWKDDSLVDNTHDILFTVAVPITFAYGFYIRPSFNVAWTNLETISAQSDAHPHLPSGNLQDIQQQPRESVIWAGVDVGINL